MTDPTEDICDALVTFVNGLTVPTSLSLAVAASKPANPKAELKREHADLQVLFVPYAEEEEKIGRGGQVLELFQISMMVIRKIDQAFTRIALSQLVRELRAEIRTGGKMAGYTYSHGETVTKFDLTQLDEQGQFLSIARFSYAGTG